MHRPAPNRPPFGRPVGSPACPCPHPVRDAHWGHAWQDDVDGDEHSYTEPSLEDRSDRSSSSPSLLPVQTVLLVFFFVMGWTHTHRWNRHRRRRRWRRRRPLRDPVLRDMVRTRMWCTVHSTRYTPIQRWTVSAPTTLMMLIHMILRLARMAYRAHPRVRATKQPRRWVISWRLGPSQQASRLGLPAGHPNRLHVRHIGMQQPVQQFSGGGPVHLQRGQTLAGGRRPRSGWWPRRGDVPRVDERHDVVQDATGGDDVLERGGHVRAVLWVQVQKRKSANHGRR